MEWGLVTIQQINITLSVKYLTYISSLRHRLRYICTGEIACELNIYFSYMTHTP